MLATNQVNDIYTYALQSVTLAALIAEKIFKVEKRIVSSGYMIPGN